MSRLRLAVAWGLAAVAIVVAGAGDPSAPLAALHPTALATLALVFVAGVPATGGDRSRADRGRTVPTPLALASLTPPLALAGAIDAGRGEPAAAWSLALAGGLLVALAALATARAAADPRARRVHGLWFWGFVCGLPLLGAALAWAGRPGEAPVALAAATAWSPLGFAFEQAGEGPLPAPDVLSFLRPLAASLAALVAVELTAKARRAPRGSAALAALALLAVGAPRAQALDSRVHPARIELTGPIATVTVDAGRAGTATLAVALAAGERRTYTVLLPILNETARQLGAPPALTALPPGGAANFVGWVEDDPARAAWARVSRGLRARPAPVPEARAAGWSAAGLALLAAALLVALGGHRRPGIALATQLVVAAAFVAYAPLGVRAPTTGATAVLDLDLDSGAAALAVAARDRLELGTAPWPARVETEPAGVALDVRIVVEAGTVRAILAARGAVLVTRTAVDPSAVAPGLGGFPAAADDLDRLAERLRGGAGPLWIRGADGAWAGLAGPPPAWAAAGIPPGVPGVIAGPADVDGGVGEWRRFSGRALDGLDLVPRGL